MIVFVNSALYTGVNPQGIPLEIARESHVETEGREAWIIYAALSANERGSVYITHTETLEQAMDLADSLTDSDLPHGWSYESVSEPVETHIVESLAASLADLRSTDNMLRVAPQGNALFQLGYLAALGDVSAKIADLVENKS